MLKLMRSFAFAETSAPSCDQYHALDQLNTYDVLEDEVYDSFSHLDSHTPQYAVWINDEKKTSGRAD